MDILNKRLHGFPVAWIVPINDKLDLVVYLDKEDYSNNTARFRLVTYIVDRETGFTWKFSRFIFDISQLDELFYRLDHLGAAKLRIETMGKTFEALAIRMSSGLTWERGVIYELFPLNGFVNTDNYEGFFRPMAIAAFDENLPFNAKVVRGGFTVGVDEDVIYVGNLFEVQITRGSNKTIKLAIGNGFGTEIKKEQDKPKTRFGKFDFGLLASR